MNQDEIKKLAIECASFALKRTYSFTSDELATYTASIEAPLQARIAQLEEALQVANKYMPVYGRSEEFNTHIDIVNDANNKLPNTWLSEHDKEVEAKERERCAVICDTRSKLCATRAELTDDEDDNTDLKSQAWQFSMLADEIRSLK